MPRTVSDGSLRIALLARSVYPLHGYGGLERHVGDLVRHLVERGISVTLITRRPAHHGAEAAERILQGRRSTRLDVRLVPYRTFPFAGRRGTTIVDRSTAYPLFGLRAGRMAGRLAREGAVDLVHGLGASVLGYARAHRRDPVGTVPLVFNPQGLEEFGATSPRQSPLKRLGYLPLQIAVRACANAADRVIATDRSLAPIVAKHLRLSPSRVRVVPNAIDLRTCDRLADPAAGRAWRAARGLAPETPLLLSVGRLERNKGFHLLARALALLAERTGEHERSDSGTGSGGTRNWRWVLAGDGPFGAEIARIVGREGIGGRTMVLGAVTDEELHALYEAATIFVHPTLYEGSSLVALEAMAHRLPILATAAGGLPDKVQPDLNGWLVPAGDTRALADALWDALATPERLMSMGLESRALVEREFSWEAAVDRLLHVYREVVR